MSACFWMFAAVLAVLAVGGGVLLAIASDSDSETPAGDTKAAAEAMCQQFVGDKLAAPANAAYSRVESKKTGKRWEVVGLVDAENRLGVPLRQAIRCTGLEYLGDERWKAKKVLIQDHVPGLTGPGTLAK